MNYASAVRIIHYTMWCFTGSIPHIFWYCEWYKNKNMYKLIYIPLLTIASWKLNDSKCLMLQLENFFLNKDTKKVRTSTEIHMYSVIFFVFLQNKYYKKTNDNIRGFIFPLSYAGSVFLTFFLCE